MEESRWSQIPSVVELWSSLLRERLLLMKGAAEREEVCRDEKLWLLQRRTPAGAGPDACLVICWPAWLSPLASLLFRLRLRLRPWPSPVLLLLACFPVRNTGAAEEARSFERTKVNDGENESCLIDDIKNCVSVDSQTSCLTPIPTWTLDSHNPISAGKNLFNPHKSRELLICLSTNWQVRWSWT